MYKPRLAFLIPRLGIVDRGAEIFVYELVKQLHQDFSISIYVRSLYNNSPLLVELQSYGINIIRTPTPGASSSLTYVLEKQRYVWKWLEKLHTTPFEMEMLFFSIMCFPLLLIQKYDLMFPVNGIWGALICRLVRFIKGVPFVYSSQGGIEPMIARQKPDIYFVFNKKTLNWYREYFPKLHQVHLPIGVDIQRFTPHGKKVRLSLPGPIIMVASALIPAKNIDKTILAVAQLKKGSLLIVGKGPFKDKLEELAKKLLPERHLFTSCANALMPNYYRAADIFTFAAKGEEFGLVYLEALACGLPVVANREDHVRQLIGRAGVVCDTDDTKSYSQTLLAALNKKWFQLPRQQAIKFSWELVAEKYKQELLEVVYTHHKSMCEP